MGAGGVRGARGKVGVGMIKGKNIVSTHSLRTLRSEVQDS